MFQGTIDVGIRVDATLELDPNARGSAFLVVAWSAGAGTGEQSAVTIASGGSGTVSVTPDQPAFLHVFVDMSSGSDTGTLIVKPKPTKRISGDTSWTYSVE